MIHAFFADHHEVDLPQGHRFPMQKYKALRQALLHHKILLPNQLLEAPLISKEHLKLAHDEAYIDTVFRCSLTKEQQRALGLPLGHQLLNRARASAGGTLAATKLALDTGFCGNLSGGTHHAFAGHGEGFCVFNDLAIAAKWLRQVEGLEQVAIVDLDVHQGNGTATICAGDEGIFTMSMHCETNYPFEKTEGDLDIALPKGTEDAIFLEAMVDGLEKVWAKNPEVVLYQAGVDGLAQDRLGNFALTHQGLRERDRYVLTGCQRRNIPVVMTLGGGYSRPIDDSVLAYLGSYEVASTLYR